MIKFKVDMIKSGIISLLCLFGVNAFYSQGGVGINLNGTLPNNSAMLDVESSNKGVLIPRVALTGISDVTSIDGGNVESLLIYNTAAVVDVTPGFYFWDGGAWQRLVSGSIVGTDNQNLTGATIAGTNLQIDIESGNSTNVDLMQLLAPSGPFSDSIINLLTQNQNFLTMLSDSIDTDVDSVNLVGTNLFIYENGVGTSTDLSTFLDADNWGSQSVVSGTGFSGNGTTANPLNFAEVDGSVTNELNTGVNLTGTTLNIVDAGGTFSQTLEPILDTAKVREEWVDGSLVGLNSGDVFARRALLSNDTIVVQENGEVGIGVSDPAASLDVQGVFNRHIRVGKANNSGNISFIRADGTVGTYLGMASATSIVDFQILNQSGGGEVNILTNAGNTTGGHFSVSSYAGTNPGTHLMVKNTGFVGIGVATPTVYLDVQGLHNEHLSVGKATEAGNMTFIRADGAPGTYVGMTSSTEMVDFEIRNTTGSGEVNIRTNAGSGTSGHFSVSSFLGTNPGTHLMVKNTGMVGIGTINPTETLEVCGNAKIVREYRCK